MVCSPLLLLCCCFQCCCFFAEGNTIKTSRRGGGWMKKARSCHSLPLQLAQDLHANMQPRRLPRHIRGPPEIVMPVMEASIPVRALGGLDATVGAPLEDFGFTTVFMCSYYAFHLEGGRNRPTKTKTPVSAKKYSKLGIHYNEG